MVNPKMKLFDEAISKLDPKKLAAESLLSPDLAQRVGALTDRSKITIRLDARVIDEAKKESEVLGVGYQKIINDRLLEIYDLEEVTYLRKREKESDDLIKNLISRIESLESKI